MCVAYVGIPNFYVVYTYLFELIILLGRFNFKNHESNSLIACTEKSYLIGRKLHFWEGKLLCVGVMIDVEAKLEKSNPFFCLSW